MMSVKSQKEEEKRNIRTCYIYSKIGYIALNCWSNPTSNPSFNTNETRGTGRSRYRGERRRGRRGREPYYRDDSSVLN